MKRSIAKKLSLIMAAVSAAAAFSGCASTPMCEESSLIDAARKSDEVSACLYAEGEEFLTLPGSDKLAELMDGEWDVRNGFGNGEKVISLTVSTQYEVCFFDDGTAMIYYGYCGVFEKDRQYYNVTLDTDLNSLVEYVKENGTVVEDDEKGTE